MTNRTHVDIGSSKLGYRKVGSGPDIVFVHGWPLHRETWRNVVPHLPNYTCHLIDLPGCGASITPAGVKVSPRAHVEAVVDAIGVLGLDNIVLVGHDSGGLITRFVAERIPDLVAALVLSGTEIPFCHPPLIKRLQLALRVPGSTAVMKRLINTPRFARSNQILGGSFSDRDLIEGNFRIEVLDPVFRDNAAIGRQVEILANYTNDFADEVAKVHPKLTVPSLFIWGRGDPYFPVGEARQMATKFGGPTRFETIDDARLLVHEEHPEQFASLCADFLDKAL